MNFYCCCLFSFFNIIIFSECLSQELEYQSENFFNKSDLLVNGRFYYEDYPNADGHPFFKIDSWDSGSVVINGIVFSGVELKLDIMTDKLILKCENVNKADVIVLNNELVDSFTIGNNLFVRNGYKAIEANYIEKIYSGNTEYFKVYKKEFIKEYNSSVPYGRISKADINRYIFSENEVYKVNSKKELLKVFPPYKKEIKSYLKNNYLKYRNLSNVELRQLIIFCEKL